MAGSSLQLVVVARDLSPRGAGSDARDRIARFLARGVDVAVVCEDAEEAPEGIVVHECPGLASPWRQLWAFRGLASDLGDGPPDVMYVEGADLCDAGISLAERRRLPYYLAVDEFVPPGGRLRLSRRWCLGVVAASEELALDLARNVGIPSRMIHVVHPGLKPPAPRALPPDSPSPPRKIQVVGAAGSLTPGSGFATFLNAARRVLDTGIDAEFVVAGTGEEESELRRRAERLRIADRMTFAADASQGDGFWDVLDVYCQPSLTPTVGRGLRIALSHGVPSLASDVDGVRLLVQPGETGLRVPPGDTNALAKGIGELLADRAVALEMGALGRERVLREHDPEWEADALLDLFERAVATAG